MATMGEKTYGDVEAGRHGSPDDNDNEGSQCFSDAEEQSLHSPVNSNYATSPYDELRLSGASSHDADEALDASRTSCISDCSVDVDLESGVQEIKVNMAKDVEKDCRICHLGLQSAIQESGVAIELGCSCKDDLGAAHKQCAETWFKIKGNKTCEICGSTAKNVVGTRETELIEQVNEANNTAAPPAAPPTEARRYWRGHRFLNFLLACMVFAFVISWLFHFNVPAA